MPLKFNDYEMEVAQAELAEAEASGGAGFWKPEKGTNVVRIIPATGTMKSPLRVTYQHSFNLPDGSFRSVICAKMEAKKPCVVCQRVDELRQSQSKDDQEVAKKLWAKRRVFANIIDRNKEEDGPKVWGFGKQIHEQLMALRTDTKGGGNYAHPVTGFDIIIKRKGEGLTTEYTVLPDRETTPLGPSDEVMQEWIDTQHNLNNFVRLTGDEEIYGYLDGEPEEQAAPRRPAPRQLASGSRQQQTPAARPAPVGSARRRTAEDDALDVEGEPVAD